MDGRQLAGTPTFGRALAPALIPLVCATGLLVSGGVWAQSARPSRLSALPQAGRLYDVSYLWHPDLSGIRAYKKKLGRVLGPRLAARLRIVKGPRRYGLIYDRDGDARGTWEVARAHSRILGSRGLEPASAIPDRDWTEVVSFARRAKRKALPERGGMEAARPPTGLEAAVEDAVKRLRRRGRIAADERTAWSVYDLTSGRKLVDINEDARFQAASMVKPFFALAYFHKVRAGELRYGPQSRRMMRDMIQRSSNGAANWVLRKIGGPRAAQRLLERHYGGILRDISIVEYIPSGGRTYRNKASAHDYSRFLSALWDNDLPGSHEMKRLMALPNRDRLYTGAREVPRGTKVYNKTGSTKYLCGDMGILVTRGPRGGRHAYTLVGVIQKDRPARNYTRWIRSRGDVIREISNVVSRGMRRRYGSEPATQLASR
ncbi:MAG: serine hydrolase [Elusimicrobiota bacterium]